MDIYGKIAVITGAASGIGEAVARELGGLGVKVMALVDRSPRSMRRPARSPASRVTALNVSPLSVT